MSSSPSTQSQCGQAEASSSRPPRQPTVEDDNSDNEEALLSADPLENSLPERWAGIRSRIRFSQLIVLLRISFKRKLKAPVASAFSIPRFLSSPLSGNSRQQSPLPRHPQSRVRQLHNRDAADDSTELILSYLDGPGDAGGQLHDTKDANGLDWYVEGPGRRVGYDDLTAIDWIFEYAKERQRLRFLYSNSTGILGYIRQLADASQIWLILVAAGIASGAIAAFIDIASDWLGDLKTGYCSNVDGDGRFYLNKNFCCWGYSG